MLKEIENYSNYLVSDDGRIFNKKGHEIKQRLNRDGYPTIFLWKNNKGTCYCVHRRVAIAFISNPENKPCINHKDGNKANNNLDNLEWCTYSENLRHAIDTGLFKPRRGEENGSNVISEATAHEICEMMQDGYRNNYIYKKLKISSHIVKNIRRGNSWGHVSSKYNIPARSQALSEETVRWICHLLEEGKTAKQIIPLSTNPAVNHSNISKIKHKIIYKEITSLYSM